MQANFHQGDHDRCVYGDGGGDADADAVGIDVGAGHCW